MGNWHHYLRVFVLFFGVLLFSGCGGCFGKMTAGELACESLSVESTTVEAFSWATFNVDFAEDLPEDVEKIEVLAELAMADWEPGIVAVRSLDSESLQWYVPLFAPDPLVGGSATLQLILAGETCSPFDIEIAPVAPAAGATLELMEKTARFLEADIEAYGVDVEDLIDAISLDTLEFDTSLPLPVWSHALSLVATDHPSLEMSFYEAIESRVSSPDAGDWVMLLDAIVAASYDFDEFESLIESTNENSIEGLTYAEYDPSLFLQQNTGIPFFLPEISGPERLSELMIHSTTRCAVHESGVLTKATMNALGTVLPMMKEMKNSAGHMADVQRTEFEILKERVDASEQYFDEYENMIDRNASALELADFVLEILSALTALDRALHETIRGGCQLLPS